MSQSLSLSLSLTFFLTFLKNYYTVGINELKKFR